MKRVHFFSAAVLFLWAAGASATELVGVRGSNTQFTTTMGIAVGDVSPKNLLFTLAPRPECFLIDSDAMRLRGASVLPQAETPDWQVPPGEERGTAASDVYKLGLLAVRLFARDQTTADPATIACRACLTHARSRSWS